MPVDPFDEHGHEEGKSFAASGRRIEQSVLPFQNGIPNFILIIEWLPILPVEPVLDFICAAAAHLKLLYGVDLN
jgi:hypothetical protein